jgi:hypothetical protein
VIKVTVTNINARSSARQPRTVVVKVPGPQGSAGTANIGTVTVLDPDQNPTITASGTEVDRIYNYGLPRAAVVSVGTVTALNPDESPTVTATTTDGDVAYNFGLPEAASFTVNDNVVSPNVAPSVNDTVTDGDVALTFDLPRAATVSVGTTTVVNPDQNPDATGVTDGDGDVTVDFDLPRAPTFAVGSVSSVSSTTPAAISDVGSDGDIVLDFDIPVGANNIVISPTPPVDTEVLWLDESEGAAAYSVYMEDILDVDYGSGGPSVDDVLVWDGDYWVPDSRVAVLG